MPRSAGEIEELFGRQFALEALVTQLAWSWAGSQPHPPTALAGFLRPVEDGMAKLAASQPSQSAATRAALETVRGIALELERTLQSAALRRAGGEGGVQ